MNRNFLCVSSAIFMLLSLFSCKNDSNSSSNNSQDSLAIKVEDEKNADLWAYLYSHEFVADSLTLTFYKDRAYVNETRIADALVVSDNEETVASLLGICPRNGKTVRFGIIREKENRMVIDMTDKNHNVFYMEKETEGE